MVKFIKKDDCPINVIAQNIGYFQDKQVSITNKMMEKLVNEAKEAGEENVKITELKNGNVQYDIVIPGEVTTKISMVQVDGSSVRLLSVEADDIQGLKLNSDIDNWDCMTACTFREVEEENT